MNKIIILVFAIIVTSISHGHSLISYERTIASHLEKFIIVYKENNNGNLPNNWEDIFLEDRYFYAINSVVNDGSSDNFTEFYSFIDSADREKFTNGQLILIYSFTREVPKSMFDKISDEDEKSYQERIARYKPGRFLIYEKETRNGPVIKSERWPEEKIQEMLNETGIIVPASNPFQPEKTVSEVYAPVLLEKPNAESISVRSDVLQVVDEDGELKKEISRSKTKEWLLYLILSLLAIASLFFVYKNRKT